MAIVSVGATNPFGHPFAPVLQRLRGAATRIYRTDQDGSVTVRVGNDGLRVRSYREQQRTAPFANLGEELAACARRALLLESD